MAFSCGLRVVTEEGTDMPKGKFGKQSAVLLGFLICTVLIGYAEDSPLSIGPQKDLPVSLRFFGSATADRFTRELDESFQGVLQENFLATAEDGVPAGFVNASLPGFPWAGTMWSRDGGTFMRELVMRGYYRHAALLAECLIDLVQKNREGFYAFPEYFKGSKPGPGLGAELDGTSSIVIGMALLWERLPQGDRAKDRIYAFLFQEASPVNYLKSLVKSSPLAAGTGEFGCGVDIPGECYNVVQNNLTRLALLAAAEMARESGSKALSEDDQRLAVKIQDGMEKYLVNKDGSWIWCIDVHTLKPNRAVLESAPNRGFGGANGVASMYADVRGLQPLASRWSGVVHSEKTFQQLYNTPLRKIEFERYGIWTQFDLRGGGMLTSPSYGQGYAIQAMLLFDKLAMAEKALGWLADATYSPIPEYKLHRASPYYFYERMYSPDAVGKVALDEGCGALNLVNVSEPLKVSRLMLGVDDSSLETTRMIPRIPYSWKGVEALNWPIRSRSGVVRADILFERKGTGGEFTLKLPPGDEVDDLEVRMPSKDGYVWREKKHAQFAHFATR
jgi:hypothetical protein